MFGIAVLAGEKAINIRTADFKVRQQPEIADNQQQNQANFE